jgi:origin recognition complex subunit 1
LPNHAFRQLTPPPRSPPPQEVVVLLLDELDYLVTRTQSVIYNLFEWASSAHAPLVVIGISNTMDLPERLLPRVHSRLGIRRINFLPYSHSEIEAIIRDRLRDLDAFEAKAVELCARKVAAVSGDMRRALEVCRLAAQLAERAELDGPPTGIGSAPAASVSSPTHVDVELIEKAARQLRGSASLRTIAALPKQQLLLLCCAVLQQRKTGLAEVALDRLAAHHAALSRRDGAVGLAAPAELQQMLARLKDGRMLGLAGAPGRIRLLVQPDDVKQAARQQGGFLAGLPWGD